MSNSYNPQCPSYQNEVYSDNTISTVAPSIKESMMQAYLDLAEEELHNDMTKTESWNQHKIRKSRDEWGEVYSDTSESFASSDDFKNTGTTVIPTINFNLGDEVVLVVDKKGLTYRGKLAADAGECYAMLTEFLNRAKEYKLL